MRIRFAVDRGGVGAGIMSGGTVVHYRPRHCKATYARFARRGMGSYGRMKWGRRTDPASRMLATLAGKRDARRLWVKTHHRRVFSGVFSGISAALAPDVIS